LLQVAVEILVRIDFRRVRREIEYLDLLLVLRQPVLDELAVMNF
jgi:hypothetical protein